jgi:hypothetical protein
MGTARLLEEPGDLVVGGTTAPGGVDQAGPLRAAADRGWLDYDRVLMESLVAIRRAGADLVITYGARDAARLLAAGWTE